MGRAKGGRNRTYTFEEKLAIVKRSLTEHMSSNEIAKATGIHDSLIRTWVIHYLKGGEEGLKPKKRGHPSSGLQRQTLSEVEQLKQENFNLKVENERLKKGYIVKGVGSKKVYVTLSGKIIKSPSK
jgi:transposase-like protein